MQSTTVSTAWIATCPKGMESLLVDELTALGAEAVKPTVAAVHFEGTLEIAYQACLWSRIANRILLPLHRFKLQSADDLYQRCNEIAWEQHLTADQSVAVDFVGTSQYVTNSLYGSQRVKDALVDRIRTLTGSRPSVDTREPDIRIQARLHRGQVTVSLDISGESLHRRGYRTGQGSAPLKENLAAALLLRAAWPQWVERGGALLDPMCGSGTLLIEAAMIAADIAPGIARQRHGFSAWLQHDGTLWESLVTQAEERKNAGLETLDLDIRGYDANPRILEVARKNIENAGLDEHIRVAHKPLDQFGKSTADVGLLITNPPYGARLGELEGLIPLYQKLGAVLQKNFSGWRAAVFTGNLDLARQIDLSPSKQYSLFNGAIDCKLLVFDKMQSKSQQIAERLSRPAPVKPLDEDAQMLLNRLRKNAKRLSGWLKKSQVSCYRLYDADIPEFAAAIDIYDQSIHVQEYAAPNSVSETLARQRFASIKQAVKAYAQDNQGKVYYKERRRQQGDAQYQRLEQATGDAFEVQEGRASFEVNLADYLDTGLFLDHRPVRKMVAQMARGKSLLNLFCYTATVTVQAALAGAERSLSIDMSNTYLDWAQRNYQRNGLDKAAHQLVRADCLQWLDGETESQTYDVIFLDPPTFSNSKKMETVLDIQRDHPQLIRQAMAKLTPAGTLIFSNNFRRFKMDELIARQFDCENITAQTLDPDFQRNQRIHNVWSITRRSSFDG
ncbi:MAG: bifunctional 23S rRNA (guanine(2069)-N(7))-methyltransferase RlmK/23S rRNA (guanine(2445)-N(2))-methyltransferase RlmL [Porticoccaceae bacterium]